MSRARTPRVDVYRAHDGWRCGVCGERRRGWRTLAAHQWVEHRGET